MQVDHLPTYFFSNSPVKCLFTNVVFPVPPSPTRTSYIGTERHAVYTSTAMPPNRAHQHWSSPHLEGGNWFSLSSHTDSDHLDVKSQLHTPFLELPPRKSGLQMFSRKIMELLIASPLPNGRGTNRIPKYYSYDYYGCFLMFNRCRCKATLPGLCDAVSFWS